MRSEEDFKFLLWTLSVLIYSFFMNNDFLNNTNVSEWEEKAKNTSWYVYRKRQTVLRQ